MCILYKNGSCVSFFVNIFNMFPSLRQIFRKSGNCFQKGRQNENKCIFVTCSSFFINTYCAYTQSSGFVDQLFLINWIKFFSIGLQSLIDPVPFCLQKDLALAARPPSPASSPFTPLTLYYQQWATPEFWHSSRSTRWSSTFLLNKHRPLYLLPSTRLF